MSTDQNESKRLKSLYELCILDTPKNPTFDRITGHCVGLFNCSTALITLVDDRRQWFLSSIGEEVRETPREMSFSAHIVATGSSLLISNALHDERFCALPQVRGAMAIRSYLGTAIRAHSGEVIGTLCIADQRANHFGKQHISTLAVIAAIVQDLIEARSHAIRNCPVGESAGEKDNRLVRSERIFKQAEEVAKIGSWELNLDTQCLTWSNEAFVIFGSPEKLPSSIEDTFFYYAPDDRPKVTEAVSRITSHGGSFVFEASLNAADGTLKKVKAMGEYLDGNGNNAARLVGIIQDVTEANHARLALERAVDRDGLTDLYNRNAFDRFLQETILGIEKSASTAFLLMLDLDGFKDINDTFGHLVGDVILQEISSRIFVALPNDAIVARWGGDEFVIITTTDFSSDDAKKLGEGLLVIIERGFEISGRTMGVSATCGLAEIDGRASAREIIRRADLALYYGKRREPGRVHLYFPEMEKANQHRQTAIATVREALDGNRLFAGYQPIVNLETRRLVGLEALMRLNTPAGDQITATQVLPAILDPILSREIGERMLSCVSNDWAEIEQAHPALQFISVNATEADLLSRDFSRRFLSRLKNAAISPDKITLEITETMLMVNDTAKVQSVLSELSAVGVRIALDDFGTGFSSLSHLRDFPIDKVKIDQSFIKSLVFDNQTRLIVHALINMANNLGVLVIAEGIETEEQRVLLLRLGCNLGQGYLFSPAETSSRIKAMEFPNKRIGVDVGLKVA